MKLTFSLAVSCRPWSGLWSRRNREAPAAAPTVSARSAPLETGSRNAFMRKDGAGGYARSSRPTSRAEAKLQEDGKDVAQLATPDADRVPGGKEKLAAATGKINEYPLIQVGQTSSSPRSCRAISTPGATRSSRPRQRTQHPRLSPRSRSWSM